MIFDTSIHRYVNRKMYGAHYIRFSKGRFVIRIASSLYSLADQADIGIEYFLLILYRTVAETMTKDVQRAASASSSYAETIRLSTR